MTSQSSEGTQTIYIIIDLALPKIRVWPKVGHATKGTKDVSNIIRGLDSLLIFLLPPLHDTLNDRHPSAIEIDKARTEAAREAIKELDISRQPWRRPVEVRRRAHHNDPAAIDLARFRGSHKYLQHSAIFLCGGAVFACPVCQDGGVLVEGVAESGAVIEDVGGGAVAGYDGWRGVGGGVGELLAVLFRVGGVVQFGGSGEGNCLFDVMRF